MGLGGDFVKFAAGILITLIPSKKKLSGKMLEGIQKLAKNWKVTKLEVGGKAQLHSIELHAENINNFIFGPLFFPVRLVSGSIFAITCIMSQTENMKIMVDGLHLEVDLISNLESNPTEQKQEPKPENEKPTSKNANKKKPVSAFSSALNDIQNLISCTNCTITDVIVDVNIGNGMKLRVSVPTIDFSDQSETLINSELKKKAKVKEAEYRVKVGGITGQIIPPKGFSTTKATEYCSPFTVLSIPNFDIKANVDLEDNLNILINISSIQTFLTPEKSALCAETIVALVKSITSFLTSVMNRKKEAAANEKKVESKVVLSTESTGQVPPKKQPPILPTDESTPQHGSEPKKTQKDEAQKTTEGKKVSKFENKIRFMINVPKIHVEVCTNAQKSQSIRLELSFYLLFTLNYLLAKELDPFAGVPILIRIMNNNLSLGFPFMFLVVLDKIKCSFFDETPGLMKREYKFIRFSQKGADKQKKSNSGEQKSLFAEGAKVLEKSQETELIISVNQKAGLILDLHVLKALKDSEIMSYMKRLPNLSNIFSPKKSAAVEKNVTMAQKTTRLPSLSSSYLNVTFLFERFDFFLNATETNALCCTFHKFILNSTSEKWSGKLSRFVFSAIRRPQLPNATKSVTTFFFSDDSSLEIAKRSTRDQNQLKFEKDFDFYSVFLTAPQLHFRASEKQIGEIKELLWDTKGIISEIFGSNSSSSVSIPLHFGFSCDSGTALFTEVSEKQKNYNLVVKNSEAFCLFDNEGRIRLSLSFGSGNFYHSERILAFALQNDEKKDENSTPEAKNVFNFKLEAIPASKSKDGLSLVTSKVTFSNLFWFYRLNDTWYLDFIRLFLSGTKKPEKNDNSQNKNLKIAEEDEELLYSAEELEKLKEKKQKKEETPKKTSKSSFIVEVNHCLIEYQPFISLDSPSADSFFPSFVFCVSNIKTITASAQTKFFFNGINLLFKGCKYGDFPNPSDKSHFIQALSSENSTKKIQNTNFQEKFLSLGIAAILQNDMKYDNMFFTDTILCTLTKEENKQNKSNCFKFVVHGGNLSTTLSQEHTLSIILWFKKEFEAFQKHVFPAAENSVEKQTQKVEPQDFHSSHLNQEMCLSQSETMNDDQNSSPVFIFQVADGFNFNFNMVGITKNEKIEKILNAKFLGFKFFFKLFSGKSVFGEKIFWAKISSTLEKLTIQDLINNLPLFRFANTPPNFANFANNPNNSIADSLKQEGVFSFDCKLSIPTLKCSKQFWTYDIQFPAIETKIYQNTIEKLLMFIIPDLSVIEKAINEMVSNQKTNSKQTPTEKPTVTTAFETPSGFELLTKSENKTPIQTNEDISFKMNVRNAISKTPLGNILNFQNFSVSPVDLTLSYNPTQDSLLLNNILGKRMTGYLKIEDIHVQFDGCTKDDGKILDLVDFVEFISKNYFEKIKRQQLRLMTTIFIKMTFLSSIQNYFNGMGQKFADLAKFFLKNLLFLEFDDQNTSNKESEIDESMFKSKYEFNPSLFEGEEFEKNEKTD